MNVFQPLTKRTESLLTAQTREKLVTFQIQHKLSWQTILDWAVVSSPRAPVPHLQGGQAGSRTPRVTPCARSTAGTVYRDRGQSDSASGGTSPGRRRCWAWWAPGTASVWPLAASRSTRGCSAAWRPAAGAGSASRTDAAWRNAAAAPASVRWAVSVKFWSFFYAGCLQDPLDKIIFDSK